MGFILEVSVKIEVSAAKGHFVKLVMDVTFDVKAHGRKLVKTMASIIFVISGNNSIVTFMD